jgi:hypothetical protein
MRQLFPSSASASSKRTVTRVLAGLAVFLFVLGTAEGGPAVTVTVHGGSAGDGGAHALSQRVRRWLGEHADVVVTITVRPGHALLEVDGRRREIAIDAWDDDTTARRLAVHVLDLAGGVPLPPLAPGEPAGATSGDSRPRGGDGWTRRLTADAAVRIGRGVDRTDPWIAGVSGELGLRRGRWRLGAGLGWIRSVAPRVDTPAEASYRAWPITALAGVQARGIEVVGGAVVAPLRLEGMATDTPVNLGGTVALRWRPQLGPAALSIAVGAEAWAQRSAVTIGGDPVFSTPRLASYVAIGAAWSAR